MPELLRIRCGCTWADVRCPNEATEEDGLCDWCAPPGSRSSETLIARWADPTVLGGGGQVHVDPNRRPDVCWMAGSGRVVAPPAPMEPSDG